MGAVMRRAMLRTGHPLVAHRMCTRAMEVRLGGLFRLRSGGIQRGHGGLGWSGLGGCRAHQR